jgi:hypothetical protein
MNRLPLSEIMSIGRHLSKHQALSKMSDNWGTVATVFSCASAWAVYFYMLNYHDDIESNIEQVKRQRDLLVAKRRELNIDHSVTALQEQQQEEITKTIEQENRVERLLWSSVSIVSLFTGGYIIGRFHGYRRIMHKMKNTTQKL